MDFVHDQLFDGRKIRALTIIDTFTRLSPAIECARARGTDVVATLERAAWKSAYRRPFASTTVPSSSARNSTLGLHQDVTLDFTRPGKPTDNAYIELFNGKFRAECLNAAGS